MTALRHPGADVGCPTCRGFGLAVVVDGGVAVATPCRCRAAVCPACRGAGYVQAVGAFRAPVRRCACQEVAARGVRFDLVRIPAHYANATLDTFVTRQGGQIARLEAQKLIEGWEPGKSHRGSLLYGNVGRGKTHLAIAMLRELVFRHGVTARFVEFTHLLTDLKATFDGKTDRAAIVEPLYTVDVLLIDELGKGRCTEFEKTVLDDLVSRRYNARLAILATTNFDPKGHVTGQAVTNLAQRAGGDGPSETFQTPALLDRIDERVFSRLREMCDFVPVDGPDHRELLRDRTRSSRRA